MSTRRHMQRVPLQGPDGLTWLEVPSIRIDETWCVHYRVNPDGSAGRGVKVTHRPTGLICAHLPNMGLDRAAAIARNCRPPAIKFTGDALCIKIPPYWGRRAANWRDRVEAAATKP